MVSAICFEYVFCFRHSRRFLLVNDVPAEIYIDCGLAALNLFNPFTIAVVIVVLDCDGFLFSFNEPVFKS
jgi:hypothetical protein